MMLPLLTPVELLDAIGDHVETGIIVGRSHTQPPRYDIRVDTPGTDTMRINIPAERVTAKAGKRLREVAS